MPDVVALFELEEGWRMATNFGCCDPYAVTAGMPLQVRFDDVGDAMSLPRFIPVQP